MAPPRQALLVLMDMAQQVLPTLVVLILDIMGPRLVHQEPLECRALKFMTANCSTSWIQEPRPTAKEERYEDNKDIDISVFVSCTMG